MTTAAERYLTPEQVAERATTLLLDCLHPFIEQLAADACAQSEPQVIGDTITVAHPDDPAKTVPVLLNNQADVAFAVTTNDLSLPIDEFAVRYLAPAMTAIGEKIVTDIAETGPATTVFAVAPLDMPTGVYGSVASRGGISLRVMYQYDITRLQMIVSCDVLYGLTAPDVEPVVAA